MFFVSCTSRCKLVTSSLPCPHALTSTTCDMGATIFFLKQVDYKRSARMMLCESCQNCYATDTRETYLIFTGGLLGRRYRVVTRPDHDILATEQNTCVHICTNPSNTVLRASPGSHAPPLLRLIGKACEDIMNQPRRNYNCVPVGCSTSHPPIVTHFMKPDSVCSSSQPLRTFP